MRPQLVLLVPVFAFTSAFASAPSERDARIATATAATRKATRMIIDASAARSGTERPRLVEIIDGAPWLQLDGPVPPHGPLAPNDGRDVWRAPVMERAIGGVARGDRLVVTSLAGDTVACRVDRVEVLSRGVHMEGFDGGGDQPTCGQDELWAALDCDGDAALGLATGVGDESPRVWSAAGPAAGDVADAPINRLWESGAWQAAMADARDANGAEVREDVVVTAWTAESGVVYTVEAVVWSGEGYSICGGEDVVAHVAGIVDAAGTVIVPFTAIMDAFGTDAKVVAGLIDVDRDGVPEIWTTPQGFDGTVAVLGGRGTVLSVSHPWCGCPC